MDFDLQVGAQRTGTNCLFSKLRLRGGQEVPKRVPRASLKGDFYDLENRLNFGLVWGANLFDLGSPK